MKRKVTLSFPSPRGSRSKEVMVNVTSPYRAVKIARGLWQNLPFGDHNPHAEQLIGEIMPIHNVDGLRDISQIVTMANNIQRETHILEKDALPNIKLVLAPNNRLLLFDGHHSLLAYYANGRQTLQEIPHLILSTHDSLPVTAVEISFFFPADARNQIVSNWERYAVNWQAPIGQQIENRQLNSMSELAAAFHERHSADLGSKIRPKNSFVESASQ
jgi:hypothetical protein